jgi:hypothetical protein
MENSQLTAQYHVLSKRLDEALGVMQDIHNVMIIFTGLFFRLILFPR